MYRLKDIVITFTFVVSLVISLEGIKRLVNNDSKKLRVINFWATWCGPCIGRYF